MSGGFAETAGLLWGCRCGEPFGVSSFRSMAIGGVMWQWDFAWKVKLWDIVGEDGVLGYLQDLSVRGKVFRGLKYFTRQY